jgi:nucleoside-diphosphate-sugar epimerase
MRVLITGGNGKVGKVVTEHFVARGWEVRMIDLQVSAEVAGIEYIQCDITHYDDLRVAMRGCQAVVHLAAIPTPANDPGPTVFQVNVTGTFNVFEAAAQEGIRRIAQASSINTLGCAWGPRELVINYLPVDEDHPLSPADPYSFSKSVIEDIGRYYWRRDGISSVALRLPWVWSGPQEQVEKYRMKWSSDRKEITKFAELPAHERMAQIEEARQQTLAFRSSRQMEYPQYQLDWGAPWFDEKRIWRMYTFDRFNFWTIVDARDAAQAFEKGLTADYEGCHALFINAKENWLGYDTRKLAGLFYPEVSQWKPSISGSDSLISVAKARQLIGFAPDYSPGLPSMEGTE